MLLLGLAAVLYSDWSITSGRGLPLANQIWSWCCLSECKSLLSLLTKLVVNAALPFFRRSDSLLLFWNRLLLHQAAAYVMLSIA